LDFLAFACAVRLGIGLPVGFLRWIRLTLPWSFRYVSLAAER